MLCRARLDVYLFERSKNYRSGAATRRCLPFDREATTREFARYLPRETSKPLRSAPLRSALPCAVRMSARAQCICITGNALTHFNPSLHRRFFSLLFSLFSLLSPLSLGLLPPTPPLFVSPLHRIAALSTRPPRVPPSGHPFARLIHRISLAEDPRSGPLPSSCRTNACNCS